MMARICILLLVLWCAACRDGAAPFSLEVPPADSASARITYNVYGDHSPIFNAAGDSVYFASASYLGLPITRGILLSLPRTGGVVTPILKNVQVGPSVQPWLSAPALSADGSRIAYFEITKFLDHEFAEVRCPFPLDPAGIPLQRDTFATNSSLLAATLHVRALSSNTVQDEAGMTVAFAGRTDFTPDSIVNIAFPFQRLFEGEGVPVFRASWSPDGTRVVYSDGSQLLVWKIGDAKGTVIAGTDKGILPAWSPDGSWIAFTRPAAQATQHVDCTGYYAAGATRGVPIARTLYTPLTREDAQLFVVHPDGSGLKALGEGEAPAWTPDSKTVVVHRDRNLYRIGIDNGAATLIAGTLDAFEPAISRDGSQLAFARRTEVGVGFGNPGSRGQYNIWVMPL